MSREPWNKCPDWHSCEILISIKTGVKPNIFCDRQSGKDFDRPAYQKMLKRLKSGDLLIVKSIDRLGRNYRDILIEWQRITKEIGADILVLDMDLLDTRGKNGSLTGTLIADMVLQIMAYFAQTERESIHQRQAEGIAAARPRGKRLGRLPKPLPEGFDGVCARYQGGEISTRGAAAILDMSHSTFYRRFRDWEQKNTVSNGRLSETDLI